MDFAAHIGQLCDALPGSTRDTPFGPGVEVWKIGGKIFAAFSHPAQGVSVKTPDIETAALLIEVGAAERAPYFHRSWVRLCEGCAPDELRQRLSSSYDLVRGSLPKKQQAALPPVPD